MVPDVNIQKFDDACKVLATAYIAQNTSNTYYWGKVSFFEFMLAYKKRPLLPVSDVHFAQWIFWCSTVKSLSIRTIKTYSFGIRAAHLESGSEWVCWTQRFLVYQALRACKRIFGEERRTDKLEITLDILRGLIRWADSKAGLAFCGGAHNVATFKAICLTAFFGILRKDNVTMAKANAFNPNRHLCRRDFDFSGTAKVGNVQARVLKVTVRHSKVIQFDNRCHEVLLVENKTGICPFSAVSECFKLTPQSDPVGPAFVWSSKRSFLPVTHAKFVACVKAGVASLGLDPKRYSGISFRRGGASLAALKGVDKELIKELGDWKSDAYELYCKRPLQQRLVLPIVFARMANGS